MSAGWESIRGWCDGHIIDLYEEVIQSAKPGDVLIEVGVAYGKSLAYLAGRAIDLGKDVTIIGVDPWESVWGFWDDLSILVEKAGSPRAAFELEMGKYAPEERKRCQIWQVTSTAGASLYASMPGYKAASFVFIDAVHDKPNCLADIAAWSPLVAPGGVLAGHDHTPSWPGVEEACLEAFGAGGYEQRGSCWVKKM